MKEKTIIFLILMVTPIFASNCLKFEPPQLNIPRSDILQEIYVNIESICEDDVIVKFENSTKVKIDPNHIYLTKFMNQTQKELIFYTTPQKPTQLDLWYAHTIVKNESIDSQRASYQIIITSSTREERLTGFMVNVAEGKFITAWGFVFSNLGENIVLPNIEIPKWGIVIIFFILLMTINLARPPNNRMVWWQWTLITPFIITILGLII